MKKRIVLVFALIAITFAGCSFVKTAVNLTRLQFRLGKVSNFSLMGINISNKSKLSDLGTMDVLQLGSAVARGILPVSFILNVQAKNPNSKGGYEATDIYIKSFPWKLYINNKETASGDINTPFKVPGTGGYAVIPLRIEFNLLRFFKDNSLNDLANLVFSIGGKRGSTSNLKLVAKPVLGTPFGNISYPEPITIVNKTFK